MGRPSKIISKLISEEKIQVGGNSVILASGDINI